MFGLFEKWVDPIITKKAPDTNNLLRVMETNLKNGMDRVSKSEKRSDSEMIYRFLMSVDVNLNPHDVIEIENYLSEKVEAFTKVMNIGTPYVYPEQISDEIFKNETAYFIKTSVPKLYTNNSSFRPIKVLWSDVNGVYLPNPLGEIEGPSMINIYSIDFTELTVMYLRWYQDRVNTDKDIDIRHFITRELYPSILPSIMDWIIYNGFITYCYMDNLPEYINEWKISMMDPGKYSTKTYRYIKKGFDKNKFQDILSSIPSVTSESFFRVTPYDGIEVGYGNKWLLLAMRQIIILDLISIFPNAIHANIRVINKMELDMKLFKRSPMYDKAKKICPSPFYDNLYSG